MKNIFCLLLVFLSLSVTAQSEVQQQEHCSYQISLLTCSAGEELYTTFGHSALRIWNKNNGSDLVFNFGTFDFDDPYFYQKFIKGNLLYFVSVDSTRNFLWEYQYFQRGVTEQVLNFPCTDKQKIVESLFNNSKVENKYYHYHFTANNCTTRLRDLLEENSSPPFQTTTILPTPATTFRNLLHQNLDSAKRSWSKLGIDILLGSPLDKTITNREAMFLPNFLMMALDSSSLKDQKLVSEKNILVPPAMRPQDSVSPLLVFSILLIGITLLSYLQSLKIFFLFFDCIFFLSCGLLGALLLYLWLQNEQQMFQNNHNLLWAIPTHIVSAFLVFIKKVKTKPFFKVHFIYTLLVLFSWAFLPQQMNPALLPVLGILLVRYYHLSKR